MPEGQAPAAADPTQSRATMQLAEWIASATSDDFGASPVRWAKHALLDWFGVTLAGSDDPLVGILVADAIAAGEAGSSILIGRGERVSPSFAAMINGAASHALDYDDVNTRLHGHPTVPVVPALLSIAETHTVTGRQFIDAFIVGYEVECQIGEMMGLAHYDHGWHATATVGTFGAAAGCAKLLGLNAEQAVMALGIAATQAAGLKSMFGTMCKPLHAGKAAMNGLMAARWAARGFTSRTDALECGQGFGQTQSSEFQSLPIRPDGEAPYAVEQNLFKYHAACYLIHSSVEAVRALKAKHGFAPSDVARVSTRVDPGHAKVCDIPEPETGLQVKFSIRHCIAMALSGDDTSDRESYSTQTAQRDDLVELRRRVDVEEKVHANRHAAEVVVELADGTSLVQFFDVGVPAEDLDAQEARLADKFTRLAAPVIGDARSAEALSIVSALENQDSLGKLLDAVD